jgi:hypothetical protein
MNSGQRILVVIVHYFNPHGDGSLGCLRNDPIGRATALGRAITAMHDLFNNHTICPDFRSTYVPRPANTELRYQVDIRIVTTQGMTVFEHLAIDPDLFEALETNADPKMLGFEVNEIFKQYADDYDRFVFLEDDIIVHDPLFLVKLDWFEATVGSHALLQPHLYEVTERDGRGKVYIDGDYVPDQVARYRKVSGKSPAIIETQQLGQQLRFSYADNPHSGCYFISRKQLHFWLEQPWYLDRDTGFVRSFESAASLGILKTFDVYKPELNCAAFLEVQHFGEDSLNQLVPPRVDALSPRTPSGTIKSDPLRMAELEAEVKQLRIETREYQTTPLWLRNARLEGEIKHQDGVIRHQKTQISHLKELLRRHTTASNQISIEQAIWNTQTEQTVLLQNAQLEGIIRNLDTALAHQTVRIDEAEREIERLQNTLAEFHRSTSWRITMPLRFLKRVLSYWFHLKK